jgi:hypothetical protein
MELEQDDGFLPGYKAGDVPELDEIKWHQVACRRLFEEFDINAQRLVSTASPPFLSKLERVMTAAATLSENPVAELGLVRGLDFWRSLAQDATHIRSIRYSYLYPLVRLLFATPASSASAERVFSSAGFLQSGRERLTTQHLKQLTVLRDYVLQVDYNFDDFHRNCEPAVSKALDRFQAEPESAVVSSSPIQ